MEIVLFSMLGFLVPLAFVFYYKLHPVKCPDCGDTLPTSYSWFKITRRMWRAGGYLCARCGCETNMAGQKVTADTPPASFLTLRWAFLAGALLVGIGLGAGLIFSTLAASPAPVMVEAPVVIEAHLDVAFPPVVGLPQQAPAVAPVN